MKRLSLASIGLLLAFLPGATYAQCPQTETARKLAQAEPLGHYAQLVVQRIDEGIAKAKTKDKPGFAQIFDLSFLISIQSIFYMLVDTDLRAVEYKRDLTSINSCLHYDLAIIEAKIEEIRCETLEAYKRESPAAIRLLKSLANFTNQRYRHLVKGALEPEHEDNSWQFYYEFDEPFEGWCCVPSDFECQVRPADECLGSGDEGDGALTFYTTRDACVTDSLCALAEDKEPTPRHIVQCPFDSDYLASSSNGYGCDLDALERIEKGLIEGLDEEIEALQQLADTRDEFLEDIDHIKETTEKMDEFVDGTMLSEDEREALKRFGDTAQNNEDDENNDDEDDENRGHKRVYGCFADLTPQEREELETPEGDEKNFGSEGELTEDIKPSQEWVRIPLRSAFFFRKDHLEIWKAFFRLQLEWSSQREFPDYLKHPDEYFDEDKRQKAMQKDSFTRRLFRIPIDYVRSLWNDTQTGQAQREAAILPKGQDMSVQIRDMMQPVRPAMRRNSALVSTSDGGLRKFGINFAYYLRRSCIYRPCNEKLETIMQILLSDECFSYAKSADVGDYEDCQDAVRKLKNE